MQEIYGDAGDSFTKWLWNCDNVLVRVEPHEVNFRSLENFALKVGRILKFPEIGGLLKMGGVFEIGGLNPSTNYEICL